MFVTGLGVVGAFCVRATTAPAASAAQSMTIDPSCGADR
jgi:hypothetical protein